ncbi:helix-turn-helix domain-containing protein [Streptomyces stramineus]
MATTAATAPPRCRRARGAVAPLRQARGMSLAGLSRLVHYTKGYLSRVETGEKP